MKKTLTVFDASGIQGYVFATNKLQHHVAASFLVEKATDEWLRQVLEKNCGKNFAFDADPDKTDCSERAMARKAELVYRGGGNAVLLFETKSLAKAVTQNLTAMILQQAPNLRILAAHVEFDWTNQSIHQTYNTALHLLAQKKAQIMAPMLMPGQSVTALCVYTNQPATSYERKDGRVRYFSAEIEAKQRIAASAKNEMQGNFKRELNGLEFTGDLDQFGEYDKNGQKIEGHSYLAVIHADGNGMGQRKKDLGDKYATPAQNCDWLRAMRLFSNELNNAGMEAFRRVVAEAARRHGGSAAKGNFLFSPIIYGGDDTTFVCDGYQALWLAKRYLEEFEKECNATTLLTGGCACAGVAITKSHFPFARAYQIAADLCGEAKKRARETRGSYMDWHFAVNGAVRKIGEIREREYKTVDGQLYLRPLSISSAQKDELRSWAVFEANVNGFRTKWRDKRGKLKELRGVLREGGTAVKEFLRMFDLEGQLPESYQSVVKEYTSTGWEGNWCVYFDAIEAYDHFDGGSIANGGTH